jgi:hypothetical protein
VAPVVRTHRTRLEASPLPAEVLVGADLTSRVKVSCAEGCDLRGIPVTVMAADEVLVTSDLVACKEGLNETADFTLKAPDQAGEHAWAVSFARHEAAGVVHEESGLVVVLTTRPHPTSMAVWAVPAPAVVGRRFTVTVGVRCSEQCRLAGQRVEICDEAGVAHGDGRLGDTPWPGTSALYVAEVELTAPVSEGMCTRSARFASGQAALAHEDASAAFSFRTAPLPEHRVTVKVTDRESNRPLDQVDVRLGLYRASTDASGLACLEVPGGNYELDAWKVGYTASPRSVQVAEDLMLHVEASSTPETDPDEARVWM